VTWLLELQLYQSVPNPKQERRTMKGAILAEDDLEVGQHVCVYGLKRAPDEGAPIFGQSFEVKAICLPYIVGQLLSDATKPTLTLDCRYLHLMRVTKEFVEAQEAGAQVGPPPQV
jgi:hypothetical protein